MYQELLILLKIDDPRDAFAVHGACGAWGVLAAIIFDWGHQFDLFHGPNGFHCMIDRNTGKCADGFVDDMLWANFVEVPS